MKDLNIGIIGCGAAAKRYYVSALNDVTDVKKNMFFVDKNLDAAKELAVEFGGGEVFEDYHDILDKVQGVIITLPHFLHYSVSADFLKSGVHVLCEKPLTETHDELKQLNDNGVV